MLAADDRIVEKTRFRVDGWDVDRFEGALHGLELMEIELDHVDDPLPTPPQGVHVLREVTDDKSFVSGQLARMKPKDQKKLVKKIYAKEKE